jgi:hypothetical protein
VTNLSRHVRDQLDMLGLKYILDMRSKAPPSPTPERFEAAPNPEAGKLERIVLMIEAHERLIDVDRGNEVRFRGVIQGLRDSLDRARSGGDGP